MKYYLEAFFFVKDLLWSKNSPQNLNLKVQSSQEKNFTIVKINVGQVEYEHKKKKKKNSCQETEKIQQDVSCSTYSLLFKQQ